MTTLNEHFASYAEYHQTTGNKVTHYVGIPLILFSTLGLLSQVLVAGLVDLGLLVWFLGSIFYCRLDLKRGLMFSAFNFGLYLVARELSWELHLLLFIVGWILQGIGHYKYEKKSPAFVTNLAHLLIGPVLDFLQTGAIKT